MILRKCARHLIPVAALLLIAVGVLGCAVKAKSPYALQQPLPVLRQLAHRLDLGRAVVQMEASASPVEVTELTAVDGTVSSSSPVHPTKPGRRWMILNAYCTNRSWDYPPVSFGSKEPTLTLGGRAVEWQSTGSGSKSAVYQQNPMDLTPGSPFPAIRNVQNAQVSFIGECEVSSRVQTYTLTWDLRPVGVARVDFRF